MREKADSKIILIVDEDEHMIIMNALREKKTVQAGRILKDISNPIKREVNLK